ncbi:K+-transporting ATPase ATPase C chain [Pedococcus dokdonensis]|uniref:Potassium-transporting ATPase KdpC subunit n=1 Tax=Pedococcus dokdonensis TaxID=443156 RepID=A0A1H0USJ1_9MICO|nr:potassium-transporting ATPase subunit KdpC [Pedococcus dokdonensis]SDP68898.1 K+-transporting ATPase ATPase C chain [Pedococcus dokdonensis]
MSSLRQLVASVRMLLVLTLLLGVVYPAVVWGVGRLGLADRADGSLVSRSGVVVGSSLLGQDFTGSQWFHGRPSASSYAGGVSGGSNLAATAQDQVDAVRERKAAWAGVGEGAPPADVLTASGSGLDPHVSPAAALAQVARVSEANGLDERTVRGLVEAHTQGRSLGFLGEPRVNVLELNVALADLASR